MDTLKKEHKEQFEKERDFHDKTLKESKANKKLCESQEEWIREYKEKNNLLEERNDRMLAQLKKYYYIHFRYTG